MGKPLTTAVLFLAATLTGVAGLAAADDAKKLLGKWDCKGGEGPAELVFNQGGKLVFDGETYGYTLSPGVIHLQTFTGASDYGYAFKGNALTVTFPDGSRLACSRREAKAGTGNKGKDALRGGERFLRGTLCSWSGSSTYSSSYSSTMRAAFDGMGRFSYGGESSFSAKEGLAYSGSPSSGGTYRVEGDNVYLTFGDGSTGTATVHFRQADGTITELMFNGKLYGSGLCN